MIELTHELNSGRIGNPRDMGGRSSGGDEKHAFLAALIGQIGPFREGVGMVAYKVTSLFLGSCPKENTHQFFTHTKIFTHQFLEP